MKPIWVFVGIVALAGTDAAAEPSTVNVRLSNLAVAAPEVLFQAKSTAVAIFARIGVTLQWKGEPVARGCIPLIEIRLEAGNPGADRPESMAYAMPYVDAGVRIRVFVGRVASIVPAPRVGALLGHVLAHEIAHVLQGDTRHSDQGLMRARWDKSDFRAMDYGPLPFAPLDVLLIHAALERPQPGAAAGSLAATNE